MKTLLCHLLRWGLLGLSLGLPLAAAAHPMPASAVLLTVHERRLDAEVQVPLNELQAAWGHAANDSSARLLTRYGPALRAYLTRHIRALSPDGRPWTVAVGALAVHETQTPLSGPYRELTAQVQLWPPAGADVRQLDLCYDAVIHQVVTHQILVAVRQDWAGGLVADTDTAARPLGVIALDVVNNRVPPLPVRLAAGSAGQGFRALVQLGIRHIADGPDHLLFLLALLLPAPLRARAGRWAEFGGARYSLRRLLLLVSAFTLGHSLTLLLGTLGWVRLPAQPVEILIALSILISAAHAARPLFPGREAWVAAGFGLVHGLAFARTLAELRLEAGPLALSLLGFNLGIELMQLWVVALTVPWLLLLARTPAYAVVRVAGAAGAGVAALAWLLERATGQANPLADAVGAVVPLAPWGLAGLALVSGLSYWRWRQQNPKPAPEPAGGPGA